MKVLVVYSSRTGNTKMVAEAIHEVMPTGAVLAAVEDAPDPADFDFIAVGFWVDKGMPDALAKEFMAKISNKQVGLFGTLGAWPDSEHARECMAGAVKCMEDNGNSVMRQFICMGKVDPRLIEAMQKMPEAAARHAMTPERKARLEEAAKHPDAHDLEKARQEFTGVCCP